MSHEDFDRAFSLPPDQLTEQEHRLIASLVTRDWIAGVFGLIRTKGVDEALKELALDYIRGFGPNIHVQWYLDQTGTPYTIPDKFKEKK